MISEEVPRKQTMDRVQQFIEADQVEELLKSKL
jgi:hypothetical protein